jgi:fused signal recognition particle receptor
MGFFSFFSREKKETLDQGLAKTKENFFSKLTKALLGKSSVDDEVLDNLEEILIGADVGVETTLKIVARIQERVARDKYTSTSELNRILREEISVLMEENRSTDQTEFNTPFNDRPYVIMVVGVNGVGKTTTIAKLAHQYKQAGKSVVLGAADTFRAAAVDQIRIWSERVGVPLVEHGMNADPAAVSYDAVLKGKNDRADVVIIDNCIASHNGCIGVGARGQGRVEAVSCSMLHNVQSGVASKDAGSVILLRRCRHAFSKVMV